MARPRKENADYFSHDTNMRSHRKVIALRSKFGITGYAIYSMLLEHIASCDFFKAKYNDIELEILAGDFGVESSLLGDIVNFCDRLGLIQKRDGYIECESMLERLQDLIKKRDRERSREKPKDEEGKFVSVTETHSNYTGMPQSKVKESKEKEIKYIYTIEDYVSSWNSIEVITQNRKDVRGLPKTIKITDKIKKARNKVSSEYTEQEIKDATNKYIEKIEKTIPNANRDGTHRYTLFEFITRDKGLQNYINS